MLFLQSLLKVIFTITNAFFECFVFDWFCHGSCYMYNCFLSYLSFKTSTSCIHHKHMACSVLCCCFHNAVYSPLPSITIVYTDICQAKPYWPTFGISMRETRFFQTSKKSTFTEHQGGQIAHFNPEFDKFILTLYHRIKCRFYEINLLQILFGLSGQK